MIRQKLILVLGGGVLPLVLLGIVEFLSRWAFPYGISPLVKDPILNHRWKPNSKWLHSEFQDKGIPPYIHTYNRQSWLENYDVSPSKLPGTFRIFFVGDSFTEGTAPMSESLPSRVEGALNANCCTKPHGRFPSGVHFEVINAGTSSYSPLLYYLLVKQEILKYQPDMVVINVDMTDVFDDWLYRQVAVFSEDGEPLSVPADSASARSLERTPKGVVKRNSSSKIRHYLSEHFVSTAILYQVLDQLRSREEEASIVRKGSDELFAWCKDPWSRETRSRVKFSLEILEKTIGLLQKNSVDVVLSGVPHLEHFEGHYSTRPFDALEELAWKMGAGYLNSFASMQANIRNEDPKTWYIPGDMHFNPLGYERWSRAYIDYFQEK